MHCWLPLGKTLASSTSSTIQSRMLNNKLESFIAIEISTILGKLIHLESYKGKLMMLFCTIGSCHPSAMIEYPFATH